MSNVGKWKPWYDKETPANSPKRYGDDIVFEMAAAFLDGLEVEDWGCGFGRYKDFHNGPYTGIDGTEGFCDRVEDLCEYRSSTPAIMMRAVMEHDFNWNRILHNALSSAQKRIVIAVFTPNGIGEEIGWTEEIGVPDLALPYYAIDEAFVEHGFIYGRKTVETATAYGQETVWFGAGCTFSPLS